MQAAVSKKSLFASVACLMLAACHGGSSSTPSTSPPTVGTFVCSNAALPSTFTTGIAMSCTDSNASTADGSTPNYSWVFGDQTPSTSTQPTTGNGITHVYAQPGVYQVTLSVTDDHGTSASHVEAITVGGGTVTGQGVENWAWVGGSKYANSSGDYQTLLQPSALNQPSARQNAATWTSGAIVGHASGQMWMFGGYGYDSTGTAGVLNDLWAFDPVSNQWTWVAGSGRANALGNWPKASDGKTIISGPNTTSPSNIISARTAMAQWTDKSGNFWLFGGSGYDASSTSSYLGDMWMLNPVTGEATFEAGAAYGNGVASSGTQGVAATTNYPANRAFATTWVDKNGIFWLFGGQGINTAAGAVASYNDLWSYDPNPKSASHPNGQQGWMWVSGATAGANTGGNYGTLLTAASTNAPGARVSAQSWVDATGNLWLFGGDGYDSAGTYGALNDLWMYNITTGMWTWIAGSSTVGASSVYGNEGHSTPTVSTTPNTPGGRVGTVGWVDPTTGYFWLFGGSGSDSTSTTSSNDGGGALNELWVFNYNYTTKTGAWTWMGGVNVAGTAGVYVTQYPTASTYNSGGLNSPGSRVWSSSWIDNSNNFWMYGGAGLDSTGTSGYLNDLWTVQLTHQPAP